MVTKSQKPKSKTSLNKQLKAAKAKIKKLEDVKEQGLEALKHMPNIRQGVYGITFAGLTYAYYHGVLDLMPKFFFQFGDTDAFGPLNTVGNFEVSMANKLWENDVIRNAYRALSPSLVVTDMGGAEKGILVGVIAEKTQEIQQITDQKIKAQRQAEISNAISTVKMAEYQIMIGKILVAMGLAGATMLFLMETSTSEVANIGAKMLDAVTPGT